MVVLVKFRFFKVSSMLVIVGLSVVIITFLACELVKDCERYLVSLETLNGFFSFVTVPELRSLITLAKLFSDWLT